MNAVAYSTRQFADYQVKGEAMQYKSPPNQADFNEQVWRIARQVPYGKAVTYGQIAQQKS